MDNRPEEKTEVSHGPDNIVKSTLKLFSIGKFSLDCCVDSQGPSMFTIPNHPITKAHYEMGKMGIRIRFITDITKENLIFCKDLMDFDEVRNLDNIMGNYGIFDGIYYQAGAKSRTSSPPSLLIFSTNESNINKKEE